MSDGMKPPTLFWVIAGLALLWNLMGVMSYLGEAMASNELLVESYGEEAAALFASKPAWATSGYAIAVFAGVLGCIGLLLRKAWSKILFIISLLGVVVHDVWMVQSGAWNYGGALGKFFIVAVLVVAIFLIWFAHKKAAKGYLT